MAVASSAIMAMCRRQAGMASSVEEVSYEFGSLIAVALLGSLRCIPWESACHLERQKLREMALPRRWRLHARVSR